MDELREQRRDSKEGRAREKALDREDERGFQALETQRYLPRFVVRFVPRRDSAAGADYAMRGHERNESRTRTYTARTRILALRTCVRHDENVAHAYACHAYDKTHRCVRAQQAYVRVHARSSCACARTRSSMDRPYPRNSVSSMAHISRVYNAIAIEHASLEPFALFNRNRDCSLSICVRFLLNPQSLKNLQRIFIQSSFAHSTNFIHFIYFIYVSALSEKS